MDINQAYPSKYLRAADLGQSEFTLTIKAVELEDIGGEGKSEHKPVAYFMEAEKGLVLNKTNAEAIAGMHGPETNHWIGKQVILFPTSVQFQGQNVPAIRVRGVTVAATAPLGASPALGNGAGPTLTPPSDPAAPGGPLPSGTLGSEYDH